MNYKLVYEQMIANRIINPAKSYVERHHIIPRAYGGSDDLSNIVKLTGREHFVAHLLLARIYGGTMWVAILRMKGRKHSDGYINSRLYDSARRRWAEWSSKNQRGDKHWAYGKPSKQKGIKKPWMSGPNHPNYGIKQCPEVIAKRIAKVIGRKQTEETKIKIGVAQVGNKNHMFGKVLTDDHRAKLSSAMSLRRLTQEHKANISKANKGRKFSDESIEKMSKAKKGKYVGDKNPMFGKKRPDLVLRNKQRSLDKKKLINESKEVVS